MMNISKVNYIKNNEESIAGINSILKSWIIPIELLKY